VNDYDDDDGGDSGQRGGEERIILCFHQVEVGGTQSNNAELKATATRIREIFVLKVLMQRGVSWIRRYGNQVSAD
jgi:hypothetical protein